MPRSFSNRLRSLLYPGQSSVNLQRYPRKWRIQLCDRISCPVSHSFKTRQILLQTRSPSSCNCNLGRSKLGNAWSLVQKSNSTSCSSSVNGKKMVHQITKQLNWIPKNIFRSLNANIIFTDKLKKQFHWCVRCKHYQCAVKFEVKETTSLAFGAALTYTIIRDISM